MPLYPRHLGLTAATCLVLAIVGCASTTTSSQPTPALSVGSQATVAGTIASIDTQPWSYDGNAVVLLETAAHGRVSVQLPARWSLCKAPAVDVAALAVGQRVNAVGTVTAEGELVVCEHAGHRLARED